MANTWWVVIPQGDQGKSTGALELVDLRVQYPTGSAGDKAMRSGHAYNDPTYGMVVKWKGPFADEAAAKKAQNPQQFIDPLTNPVGSAKQVIGQNAGLGGLAAIGDFFSKLGQANTWIRVAEVVLGVALIGIGIAHATGTDNAISKAARTAGKAAML